MQPQVQLRESWDMCTDTSGKEGLAEASRPGLVPEMRPDHPEKPYRFVPQDPFWVILFLRLKGIHLMPPCDDVLRDPVLSRDDDSVGSVPSPQIRLIETVKFLLFIMNL